MEQSNILFLRLDRSFGAYRQSHPDRLLYFKYNGHWNALGNRVAAEAVEQFLREEGLVPRRGKTGAGGEWSS